MSESFGGLGAAHIGGDDNRVVGVEVHVVVVLAKQRQCGQVVNRDIKEAPDLAPVQVEGDDAVDAGASSRLATRRAVMGSRGPALRSRRAQP